LAAKEVVDEVAMTARELVSRLSSLDGKTFSRAHSAHEMPSMSIWTQLLGRGAALAAVGRRNQLVLGNSELFVR
jgi:hypothetical protein